ncbi:Type IV pilus biogenesis and competence protein pilQ precursor [Serratia plymuthica]|uniref:Type IV pilus biogenesis and competence protein pilQ n=1 Tax=Serratia plymuthica TaxID=82996 RepID=A0A2X4V226_SERPL|nr:Type IV pilus biogenesis and competence protein pilQ precursor [Serratia plymuthica]
MKGGIWLGAVLWGIAASGMATQNKEPISMAFQDAPVTLVLQALADYQQLNVVTATGVGGNLTLRLDNVSWQQALAVILRMGKLSMTLEGNVMMVFPEPDEQEKQRQQLALAQKQPLESVTLTLNHADAVEIAEI